MSITVANFSQIPKQIPLIQSCLDNPSLIRTQQIYEQRALQCVVDLLQVQENYGYAWDPESACREKDLSTFILKDLQAPASTNLLESHVISYLDLHKINSQ